MQKYKKTTDTYIKKNNKVYYQKGKGTLFELKDADSETFKTISIAVSSCEIGECGKNRNNVYFKNIQMTDAEAVSFEELGQGYTKIRSTYIFMEKCLRIVIHKKRLKL